MDVTGDLGNKLNAAIDKLTAAIPGIEAPILQAVKDEVAQILATETRIVQTIGMDIEGLKTFITSEREAFFNGLDQRANVLREMGLRAFTIPKPPV